MEKKPIRFFFGEDGEVWAEDSRTDEEIEAMTEDERHLFFMTDVVGAAMDFMTENPSVNEIDLGETLIVKRDENGEPFIEF